MNRLSAKGRFTPAENLEEESHNIRGDLVVDGRLILRGTDVDPSQTTILKEAPNSWVTRSTAGAIDSGTAVTTLKGLTLDQFIIRLLDLRAPPEVQPTYSAPSFTANLGMDAGGDVEIGSTITGGTLVYTADPGHYSNAYTSGTWDGETYSGSLWGGDGIYDPAHPAMNSALTGLGTTGGLPAPTFIAQENTDSMSLSPPIGPTSYQWTYTIGDFTPSATNHSTPLRQISLGAATGTFHAVQSNLVFGNQGTEATQGQTTRSAGARSWEVYAPVFRQVGSSHSQANLSGDLKVKRDTSQITVNYTPGNTMLYIPQRNGSWPHTIQGLLAGNWTNMSAGPALVIVDNALTVNGIAYRSYQNPLSTASSGSRRFLY
jgi:hypothetical protein